MLSEGWRLDSLIPQPLRMVSDCCDPLSSPQIPHLYPRRLAIISRAIAKSREDYIRTVTPIAFATELSNVMTPNNPT